MAVRDLDNVLARLTRLETQNRRIKRAASVGLALVAILVLAAQTIPQEWIVEAQAFELVNDDGDLMAAFELGDEGEPILVLYGKDGEPRASMDGTAVMFFGDDGSMAQYSRVAVTLSAADKSGPTLWADEDGTSGLIFVDGEGNGRMDIQLDAEGLKMSVTDAAGEVTWEVPPRR